MTNSILYARVSSKEQEAEGYSISAQLKLLREYASKNNFLIQNESPILKPRKKLGARSLIKCSVLLRKTKALNIF